MTIFLKSKSSYCNFNFWITVIILIQSKLKVIPKKHDLDFFSKTLFPNPQIIVQPPEGGDVFLTNWSRCGQTFQENPRFLHNVAKRVISGNTANRLSFGKIGQPTTSQPFLLSEETGWQLLLRCKQKQLDITWNGFEKLIKVLQFFRPISQCQYQSKEMIIWPTW
jgi:hypothetical protein